MMNPKKVMPVTLAADSYGKSDVRLTKVIRNGARHELLEFSVDVLLHGGFDRSYTHGDNSAIIATDSMKNTVYVVARENQFDSPETFAIRVAEHFVAIYPQVRSARIHVKQSNWKRISVEGKPHDHAFMSGGADLRSAHAIASRGVPTSVHGGVRDLLVLKTTRSAFKGFVTDRYRTLKDADDRIFATKISADWDYTTVTGEFNSLFEKVMEQLLTVFATTMSHAVQQTMYQMGQAVLDAVPEVTRIEISLPNKHRIPVNLQPFGLENHNEIFVWTDEPFGEIHATVTRSL